MMVAEIPKAEVIEPVPDIFAPSMVFKNLSINWTHFSAKAKINYEDGEEELSTDAVVKIEKDKNIWLSISKFGIEGARIFMDVDSITIISKIERSYSVMAWSELASIAGVTLSLNQVQMLLLARPIYDLDSNYQILSDTVPSLLRKDAKSRYEIVLDKSFTYLLNSFFVGEKNEIYLQVNYENQIKLGQYLFANVVNLTAKNGMDILKVNMILNDLSLSIFDPMPTTIPSTFKRK